MKKILGKKRNVSPCPESLLVLVKPSSNQNSGSIHYTVIWSMLAEHIFQISFCASKKPNITYQVWITAEVCDVVSYKYHGSLLIHEAVVSCQMVARTTRHHIAK